MHDTAEAAAIAFFRNYGTRWCRILEIGALETTGAMRRASARLSPVSYVGVDRRSGPNVDMVVASLEDLLPRFAADLVVSTSALEHDPMFWVSFGEMCRLVVRGGFIYLNVPHTWPVHYEPVDCWRFQPDAGAALEQWSKYIGNPVRLIETFIVPPRRDAGHDFVAIYGREPIHPRPPIGPEFVRG